MAYICCRILYTSSVKMIISVSFLKTCSFLKMGTVNFGTAMTWTLVFAL